MKQPTQPSDHHADLGGKRSGFDSRRSGIYFGLMLGF